MFYKYGMVALFVMRFEYISITNNMIFYLAHSCSECAYYGLCSPRKTYNGQSKVSCGQSAEIFNYD